MKIELIIADKTQKKGIRLIDVQCHDSITLFADGSGSYTEVVTEGETQYSKEEVDFDLSKGDVLIINDIMIEHEDK